MRLASTNIELSRTLSLRSTPDILADVKSHSLKRAFLISAPLRIADWKVHFSARTSLMFQPLRLASLNIHPESLECLKFTSIPVTSDKSLPIKFHFEKSRYDNCIFASLIQGACKGLEDRFSNSSSLI